MDKRTVYKAPALTSISFKAEKGFALSVQELTLWELEIDNTRQVEDYQVAQDSYGNYWSEGSSYFWE